MMASSHVLTSFHYDTNSQTFSSQSTTKQLGHTDILIQTTHSGICYTDVHAKTKQCGLGHEGVGEVLEVGPAVLNLKAGDRVGWGWLHSSCGHCTTCVTGYRQYCAKASGFAFSDLDQGAFSDYRMIDADFAYKIPPTILSLEAAPLMCAGASVFEALDAAAAKSYDRIGVVGIGGLGHMAVLFARAMGCSVTTFSSGLIKREDAFKLGADQYRDTDALDKCYLANGNCLQSSQSMDINVMLITSNVVPNLEEMLPFLARRATIVLMTIQKESLAIPYMQFVLPGHKLIASTEASRENHLKMLEFAARHQIHPWTEEFPMTEQGIERAFHKLENGNMRYRGVLTRHLQQ